MKQANNRTKWLQAALLGLGLWIGFDSGLLQNTWKRFPVSGSEALAQDLSGSWVNLTQKCKWVKANLQCKLSGKFKVSNPGEQNALASKVKFFLSSDSTLEEANDTSLKEIMIASLNAGRSKIISLQVNLPPGDSASDKFVIGLVDADNSVPEGDETNNIAPSDMIPSGTEYFPFGLGDAWEFQGKISGNTEPEVSYVNTRMVTGTKVIDGITATVFTESNPNADGIVIEEYLAKDSQGITYWGSSGEMSLFPSKMIPFRRVYFPLKPGSAIKESFEGVNMGEDLDGDEVNETADVTTTVTVAAFEDVIVPAGNFPNSVRIETKATLNVQLSGYFQLYHRKVRLNVKQTEWFAHGMGLVKRVFLITARMGGQGFIEEAVEELTAYNVGGHRKGIVHIPIAKEVGPSNSSDEPPGGAAIGFDGTNYLVAFHHDNADPPGLYGKILSGSGVTLNSFIISPDRDCFPGYGICDSLQPAIAFDGENYLVVFQRDGKILGIRISPSGTVLDEPPGFQISSGGSPSVSVAFDGSNYFVVWDKFVDTYDIYGCQVTPDGQVRNEFPIYSGPGEQVNSSFAFDGTNFLVVWRNTGSGSCCEDDTDIYGVRVTPEGVVLDSEIIPISTALRFQGSPHIIFDGTHYFVVWDDSRNDPTYNAPSRVDIFGARITPDGALLDGPPDTGGIAINTSSFANSNSRVGFDGVHYFVVWAHVSFRQPLGIFGARVSTDGSLIDGPPDQIGLPISSPPPCDYCRSSYPNILFGNNAYLVTWGAIGSSRDILGALVFP